jgi:hypothetical protein
MIATMPHVGVCGRPMISTTGTSVSETKNSMKNKIIQMNRNFRPQLSRVQTASAIQTERTIVLQPEKKRGFKLNQPSPRTRDIYFQIKSDFIERNEGGA